jgi:DNA-binding NarL/FixJ family response regulator
VQLACTPAEILHAARTEHIDLVIADTELATRHESDWIERLLALPDAPALALTCERPSLAMAIRAANLPLAGYLAKPLPHARIDELVRSAQGRLRRTE